MEPSGPEKVLEMLVETGGKRKRIVSGLNAEPGEDWTVADPGVEFIEIADEDMPGNHSSEREDNNEDAEFFDRLSRLLQTVNRKDIRRLQNELNSFMKDWLDQIGDIEDLKDETDRRHVIRHVGLFLTETGKHIKRMLPTAAKVFKNNYYIEQFNGFQENAISLKISAMRLKQTCIGFSKEKDPQKFKEIMDRLKKEYLQVKTELESLFKKLVDQS